MNRSDFLFALPSFIRGMGKCLDLGATGSKIYNSSTSESLADYKATMSDWNVVGKDMRKALKEYEKEFKESSRTAI